MRKIDQENTWKNAALACLDKLYNITFAISMSRIVLNIALSVVANALNVIGCKERQATIHALNKLITAKNKITKEFVPNV